jgi:rare lipoprotein A
MRLPLSHLAAALLLLSTGCATLGGRGALARGGSQVGVASYYGAEYGGHRTASGARFDPHQLTAAHRTLAFGTRVRVTNLANGRTAVVTITDRGPFKRGRLIDVSARAAKLLGFAREGEAKVRLDVLPG